MTYTSKTSTILTTKVRIPSGIENDFIDWQAKLNTIIAAFSGFVSLEILSPNESEEREWVVVQRFSTPKTLTQWLQSREHGLLIEELKHLINDKDSNAVLEFDTINYDNVHGGIVEVFVAQVTPGKENDYRKWIAKIHQMEARFPGFRGVYVQAPNEGQGRNWITLLQFDNQTHLDKWLSSPERAEIIKESATLVATIESHRVISPYGAWFGSLEKNGELPSLWKQTMLILLILFPIVMLELKYLSPLTANLNLAVGVFISNALSVSLISWPLMPIAIRYLGWWLLPKEDNKIQTTLKGLGIVILLYLIEIAIFWKFI